jgi:Protein of Unknown function (DUF2784)
MIYRLLARLMIVIHVSYVVFVVFGSLLVVRWRGFLWWHVAAFVWSFLTLSFDLGCPITPWEKQLWRKGGVEPYDEGFLQHHILRTRFSAEHSRRNHTIVGVSVLVLNAIVYSLIFWRR